jgi:oxaloacetate decarboxylase beta subunit
MMTFLLNYVTENFGVLQITIGQITMVCISILLFYLAMKKQYEPLLLLPIAFGMLIANMPIAHLSAFDPGGLINLLYEGGIKTGLLPPMIFLCLGAITDFSPIIANPKHWLIGIGGQLGIFTSFGLAYFVSGLLSGFIPGFDAFTIKQAMTIGIIGSSDGPTTIYTAIRLAPELLATVSIAAYSYMALVPIIQPPIMKLLTTAKERVIVMPEPKQVTQRQRIFFPIIVALLTLLLVPTAGPLIAMLMLGNLIRESGVVERVTRALAGDLLSILTMLIGLCIGASATAEMIVNFRTILVIVLGLLAFCFGTVGGVLVAKLLNALQPGTVNPLIGNSGVSAMPMAARVSQKVAQQYNPANFVIMHAMGPILASTIGSAVVAGIFIALQGR